MIHEITKAKIAARCEAYNKAHKLLNAAEPTIRSWVETLIGQPIFKKDGGLFDKFAKTKPQIDGIYIECGNYSIRAEAQHCSAPYKYKQQFGDKMMEGHESGGQSMYFADIESSTGVVTKIIPKSEPFKTDYAPEPVFEAIEKLQKIEEQVSAITDGLHHCISARLTINHP